MKRQTSPTESGAPRPWWREPWPWLLMAGPLAAIAGCAVTIFLAVQNFSDQPIVDGAVRRGLVVQPPAAAGRAAPAEPARPAAGQP